MPTRPFTRRAAGPRLGEELVDQQVDRDRVAGLRAVPGPGERDERAPRRVRQPAAALLRDHGVLVAVDDEHRARHPRAELEHRLPVGNPLAVLGGDDRLAGRVEPPPHAILDLLRGMRLGEARRAEEPLQEVGPVAAPVVRVVLAPALVGVVNVLEGARDIHRVAERKRRRDEDEPIDAIRMLGRQQERPLGAE